MVPTTIAVAVERPRTRGSRWISGVGEVLTVVLIFAYVGFEGQTFVWARGIRTPLMRDEAAHEWGTQVLGLVHLFGGVPDGFG
jgi:hypothetical protein